jgi:hypothetical protein
MGGDITLPRTCGSAGIGTTIRAVHDVDNRQHDHQRQQVTAEGSAHSEQYIDVTAWRTAIPEHRLMCASRAENACPTARPCGFHDHLRDGDAAFYGTVFVDPR